MTAKLQQCLERLRSDPHSLPWTERRDLVAELMPLLGGNGRKVDTEAVQFGQLLSNDPKWEVRKALADQLHLFSEEVFASLAARLTEDDHAFVKAAADRAMERRQRGASVAGKRRRGMNRAEDAVANLARLKGEPEAQLVRDLAHQLFENLVGSSIHELRSVLTVIQGCVENLLAAAVDGNGIGAATKIGPRLRSQLALMERLFGDMRTYTQVVPRTRRMERFNEIIHEAVKMVQAEFENSQRDPSPVNLTVLVPEHLAAPVSRHHILLALRNVIKNAFESFMEGHGQFAPGSIEITARQSASAVMITIRDTGMGLSPEEVIELARMIPGRTSKGQYGTGFGLPIAHRHIAAHDGTLIIESVEDVGTTVTITLPADSPE